MDISKLPNNIYELKKIIIQQQEIINILQRKQYAPQSEVIHSEELGIFNEVEETIVKEKKSEEANAEYGPEYKFESDSDVETEEITYTRKKRGGKRTTLPPDLPRVDEIIDLSEEDKKGMKCIGEEVSEQLIIEPAKVFVKRTIRKKYTPVEDNGDIKISPLPPRILPKSIASTSLIAYIIVSKFVDALPLYRQEKIFKRIGAILTRQSMARWLIKVYTQLLPLYNLLQDKALDRKYIQMDETIIQVLKENGKKATSKSYMWVRHSPGNNPIILYDYSPSRSGDVPLELLNGFKGYLQVDGYNGYSKACNEYQLVRVGCMDHCRRKFYDAYKTSGGKGVGKKAITYLKKVYKIEERIKDLSFDEKVKIRQVESKPILQEMKEWIDEIRNKITPKSIAGKAINYAYNEWTFLTKFLENGELNISNVWVENKIRPFVIGRKNWLFSSSVEGAKASAIFYSLIETAKANGLEPFDYFNRMLEKLPQAKSIDDFEELLPLKENKFSI